MAASGMRENLLRLALFLWRATILDIVGNGDRDEHVAGYIVEFGG